MNPERFKAIVGDWAKERPAAFFQLLPAALVGGSIANFRDFKDGGRFLLTPSFLKIVGFSPEQQARLATAKNQSEAEAIYREEFPKRTPKNIAAGIEQLNATLNDVEGQHGTSPAPVEPASSSVEDLPKTRDGRILSKESLRPLKDRVAENLGAMADDYLKNHATEGKSNAIIINPDLVRDMDPAYRKDPMGQASNVP